MDAKERSIANVLTEQICYQIPPYQRPYSWERENTQQLLEDVWEAYSANDTEYFIGSIITIEKERNQLYDVVDGQQRLTTLNLVLARLRDNITDAAAKAELGKRILPHNVLTGDSETPRLTLRRVDQTFFRSHVLESVAVAQQQRSGLPAPQLRLLENMETVDAFCADKDQDTLKRFANYLLSKVYVVFVTTYSWDSAYRLFNVLNARGMPLSNADLIKNTLFSKLGAQANRAQELEEKWLELESIVGIERLDAFFSHHRTSIVAEKARRALNEEFEPLINACQGGPLAFLDALIRSAENYMRIIDRAFDDGVARRARAALGRIGFDEWIPPLLAFLNRPVNGISEADFISLLEKITMQNWVRRLGRTARLTVYYQLISAIHAGKAADEVCQIFVKNAQNDEFLDLLGRELYGKPFDDAVLLGLEEAMHDGSVTKTYSGRLSVEHVLPQALHDEYWKERFTPDQHQLWIHRLGNLTMLSGSKNSGAKHSAFPRKKEVYNTRNKKVSFDLTKQVCDISDWTVDVVEKRHRDLLQLARQTWAIS